MSVVIETIVYCDGCGDNHSADDRHGNAKTIRAQRKRDGWTQVGSKDYCQQCSEARKQASAASRK